jgi:DNA-binding NarL/FixJ family response regulator
LAWNSEQEHAISNPSVIRILLVDDFAPWRRFVFAIARKEPGWYVISEAADGLEAVQKAERLRPDLILLDIGLPKLNGIEAARQIRKVAPNSKILFVSTHDYWEVVDEALNTGASGYLVKTDAGSELTKAVVAVFQGERYVSSKLRGYVCAERGDRQDFDLSSRNESLGWPSGPAPQKKNKVIHRHEAQFYSQDEVFLESAIRFISTALKSGNAAVVVATKPHRDNILRGVKKQGKDVDAAIQQGAYVSLDAAETLSTFMVNGRPDADRFFEGFRNLIYSASIAAKAEQPRVAICGECAALLWAEGKREAALRLEQLSNILAETHRIDILCAYPLSLPVREDEPEFGTICAEHSAVYST